LNPVTVIPWFQNDENARDSDAVYDMARLAVAANYADHASKTAWRDGVLTLLADVDSYDAAPVMALGSAVWALGVTDDISTDTDDISTDTRVVWPGVQVKDLPVELASWQAPDNSFYTKFDIDLGEGFTETTAMGALGLMAAYTSSASYSYASEIVLAANVLRAGVSDPDGEVYRAINDPLTGVDYFAAGETLEVVTSQDYDYPALNSELGQTGPLGALATDYNQDGSVDLVDFVILRARWGDIDASAPMEDTTIAMPEPASLILMAAGGAAI